MVEIKDLIIIGVMFTIAMMNRHNMQVHARAMFATGIVFIEPIWDVLLILPYYLSPIFLWVGYYGCHNVCTDYFLYYYLTKTKWWTMGIPFTFRPVYYISLSHFLSSKLSIVGFNCRMVCKVANYKIKMMLKFKNTAHKHRLL